MLPDAGEGQVPAHDTPAYVFMTPTRFGVVALAKSACAEETLFLIRLVNNVPPPPWSKLRSDSGG